PEEWFLRTVERSVRSRSHQALSVSMGLTVVAWCFARLPAPGERVGPLLACVAAAALPSPRASFRRAPRAALRAARRGYGGCRSPGACVVGVGVSRVTVSGATWPTEEEKRQQRRGVSLGRVSAWCARSLA